MRDIMGPLVDLSAPNNATNDYVVIRSIVPPGTTIPLHSHADRETMVVLEGKFGVWVGGAWETYDPGEIIEIRPNARHALKNESPDDVSLVLVTTSRMASFFG